MNIASMNLFITTAWCIIKQGGLSCLTKLFLFLFQIAIQLKALFNFQNGKSGQQIRYLWVVRQYKIVISSFYPTNNCSIGMHIFLKKFGIIFQKCKLITVCIFFFFHSMLNYHIERKPLRNGSL